MRRVRAGPASRRSRGLAGRRPSRPGARSSVRTASSSSVRQNVANATRCHLVWSTIAITRRAAATMERLICASSSVASERPGSRAKPAAPRNAVWTLIRSNRPSPRWPTTDIACQRTRPPVISTVMPCVPASSVAIRRPLVITVSPLQPPRCRIARATARPVVLASITIESPSCTSAAAAAPIRTFSSCWSRSRRSNAASGRSRSGSSAPPCVRTTRPSSSSEARSLRMVTVDTPKRADSSLTRTRPCSATRRAMSSWRSRAKTSPGAAPVGTVTRGLHTDPIAEVSAGCRVGRRASWAEANRNVKKPD